MSDDFGEFRDGYRERLKNLERSFDRLERRVDAQSELREAVSVLRAEFGAFTANMLERMAQLEKNTDADTKGIRRVLVGFSLTIAASAIGFAITVVVVFGAP